LKVRPFWLIAVANAVVLFGSAAPSPLYPVYQRLWHFSSATLTIVFAVYVAGLLISLLTLGALSDHVGRRPVLVLSLLVLIGSMVIFAAAHGVGALLIARLIQGLGTGAALGAFSAALVDLAPSPRVAALTTSIAPILGLGCGVVASALLVQYGPAPRQFVFEITAAALAIFLIAILAGVPETSPRHGFTSRAHLARTLSPRVSVPPEVRAAFIAGMPALIATWALGGLVLSLGSSIIPAQLGVSSIALGGLLLALFFFAAALAAPLASSKVATVKLPVSYLCLGVGLGLQLVGSLSGSAAAYGAGLAIAGVGFSTAFVGVIGSVAHVTPAARGQLFAAIYVVAYTAFSIPAVLGGFAATAWGLKGTTTGYTIFDLAMVALAAALIPLRARAARRPSEPAVVVSAGAETPVIAETAG
jgi:predicted MFS family arabinose efflux permease